MVAEGSVYPEGVDSYVNTNGLGSKYPWHVGPGIHTPEGSNDTPTPVPDLSYGCGAMMYKNVIVG